MLNHVLSLWFLFSLLSLFSLFYLFSLFFLFLFSFFFLLSPGWICYAEKTHGDFILPYIRYGIFPVI